LLFELLHIHFESIMTPEAVTTLRFPEDPETRRCALRGDDGSMEPPDVYVMNVAREQALAQGGMPGMAPMAASGGYHSGPPGGYQQPSQLDALASHTSRLGGPASPTATGASEA
jgi:hypothetical protein